MAEQATNKIWTFEEWRALTTEELARIYPPGNPSVVAAFGHPEAEAEGDEPSFALLDTGEVLCPTKFDPAKDADPVAVDVPLQVLLAAAAHLSKVNGGRVPSWRRRER